MWELDHKKSWVLKNWCFWTVVLEKTLESSRSVHTALLRCVDGASGQREPSIYFTCRQRGNSSDYTGLRLPRQCVFCIPQWSTASDGGRSPLLVILGGSSPSWVLPLCSLPLWADPGLCHPAEGGDSCDLLSLSSSGLSATGTTAPCLCRWQEALLLTVWPHLVPPAPATSGLSDEVLLFNCSHIYCLSRG